MSFLLKASVLASFLIVPALVGAATSSGSGTITITGSIVEEGCSFQPQQQALQMQCASGISTVNVRSPADLQHFSTRAPEISNAKMEWLDRHHRLGVMTITYQ